MEPIYVVGAGGIGCAVGHTLCAVGARVTFVDTNPHKVRWGQTHGVGLDRRPPQRATFLHFENWQPEPPATVILCTKCYDNAAVLSRVPAAVPIIPIQNGFDSRLDERINNLEGIASFVSECYPNKTLTRITRRGRLHLGFRGAEASFAVRALGNKGVRPPVLGGLTPLFPSAPRKAAPGLPPSVADVLDVFRRQAPFRVEMVPDILPYKYSKLMYNAAISPLAAAAGLDNGQLLSIPRARHLFFALLRENYAILRTAHIRLGKVGPFHPDTVNRILQRLPVAGALAWVFYFTLRKSYCSMSGDLPRGRTEIDYYNRHLIGLARDGACPLNRRVYALVKRMEQDRIAPGLGVLDGL